MQKDIIDEIAPKHGGIPRMDVNNVIDDFFENVIDGLVDGCDVTVGHLGVFRLRGNAVKYAPSKILKERIKKGVIK